MNASSREMAARARQEALLPGVSRTFALTIPQLPDMLRPAITNAYLLCRTADTIEDSTRLSTADKARHYQALLDMLDNRLTGGDFARQLLREAPISLAAEQELILRAPELAAVYQSLPAEQRRILYRCLKIMSQGMARFEGLQNPLGLPDGEHFRDYCYVVAGVVGEMLTELFALADRDIARRRDALLPLARGFGQGLQMTNILKDVRDDRERGICWLPRDLLAANGCSLDEHGHWRRDDAFRSAIGQLVAVAHHQLRLARTYTLAIPARQRGMRRFCSWALGMALYTLRNIHRRPDFRSASEVKISRQRLRTIILGCNLSVGSDRLLETGFALASRGLPLPSAEQLQGLSSEGRAP
ncbi:MAG: squalene/phytoene synthase family protein [Ectothiorhodospiraceae bacterium]|nr:squalene/phytoene synthase family protein [Ectothiorhodospiraceae bacterium]